MQTSRADDDFSDFVRAKSAALVRMAWAMTGDEHAARDAVQLALAKTWARWTSIQRRDTPEVYVRRVIVTTVLGWRRRRAYGELVTDAPPDRPSQSDAMRDSDVRVTVATALARLPARQRAVVVLRYLDDLSEQDTAKVLGCSVGTVKSQTFRALNTVRTTPALHDLLEVEVPHERR